jgi:hypothetical protein
MYHDFSRCSDERGGVADGQRDQMVDAAGHERGEPPGEGCAPVVAHDMGLGDAEVGQDGQDVPGQEGKRVGLHRLGLVRAPVSAQIRNHDLEPGPGQRRYLVPPETARVGKTVQQHDRLSLPRDLVLDADPIDVHPAHLASFCCV